MTPASLPLHEAAAAPRSPPTSPTSPTRGAARTGKTAAAKWLVGKPPRFIDASNYMIAQIERAPLASTLRGPRAAVPAATAPLDLHARWNFPADAPASISMSC